MTTQEAVFQILNLAVLDGSESMQAAACIVCAAALANAPADETKPGDAKADSQKRFGFN